MKIVDDIYQLKVPMKHNPLGYTYSYFLKDSNTLIDTGIPSWDSFISFDKQITELEANTRDIERVIITHMHNDHVGLIEYLKERSNIQVLAHKTAKERQLEQLQIYNDMYKCVSEELQLMGGSAFHQFLSRFERSFRDTPRLTPIDLLLDDGDELQLGERSLKAIWTPGHAVEHICLNDTTDRLLFSGDHVLPKITSHISLHTWEKRDPLEDYLNSLQKVKDLPVDIVLPGHERNFNNLNTRIEQLVRHHETRLNEVKEAMISDKQTVYDIAGGIHWDSRPWTFMDFWTKRMAAAETYAHLVYLRNKGEISESMVNGMLRYRLN